MPWSDNHVNASGGPADATGTEKTVPLLARTRLGLLQSVTGSTATTASTPAASAVRNIAPRLPGFSTPWQMRANGANPTLRSCLLYTSDAADEEDSVDLGGRRIIKKKNK